MKAERLLACLFGLSLALVGCGKNPEPTPEPEKKEPVQIKTVLEGEKDAEVKVVGTVYGITTDGYYIADASEKIFVMDSKTTVEIGKEVTVEGKFAVKSNKPYLKEVTTTVGEAKTAITPTVYTVEAIKALDKTAKTGVYGTYVELTGTISKLVTGRYTIIDDAGDALYFSANSKADIKELDGKRVVIDAVVSENTASTGWELAYAGGTITPKEFTQEEVLAFAKAHIDEVVTRDVQGTINVPKAHNVFSGIKYTWDSANKEVIDFAKPVIDPVTGEPTGATELYVNDEILEDTKVNITAHIALGEITADYTFEVTVKLIVTQSIKGILENIPEENMSVVKLFGIVTGFSNNQSGSLYGIILADTEDQKYTTQVDVSKEQYESVKIGQEVYCAGHYRTLNSGDRPTIMDLMAFEIKNETPVAVTYEPYFTVNSEETMKQFTSHYCDYVGRYVKFEGAYARWNVANEGKKGSTSYVCITYNTESTVYPLQAAPATEEEPNPEPKDTSFVLIYGNNSRYMGNTYWADGMDIPYSGDLPTEYAASFIAVPSYFTRGTIAMLSIPSQECWTPTDPAKAVEVELSKVPTSARSENLVLPTTVTAGGETVAITWVSDMPDVIANDGTLTPQTSTKKVELDAYYTIGGETKDVMITVTVFPQVTPTVSELFAMNLNDGDIALVDGVVVGYQQNASYSAAGAKRTGYVVMDKATGQIIYCNQASVIGGNIYSGFQDSEGNDIKIGDEVEVMGVFHNDSANPGSGSDDMNKGRHYIDLGVDGSVKVIAHNVAVSTENAVTVTNGTELASLFADANGLIQYNKLVKIVSTEENPLYFYTNSGTWTMPEKDGDVSTGNNIAFSYNADTAGKESFTTKNGTDTTFTKPIGMASQGSQFVWANAGLEGTWYSHLGYEGTEASKTTKVAYGTFYVNISYVNSSYYHVTMVLPELFSMTPVTPVAA